MKAVTTNQRIEGIVRHVLTLIAGFLAATNLLPEEVITGAQEILANLLAVVFAAIAFVRSYITKPQPNPEPAPGPGPGPGTGRG